MKHMKNEDWKQLERIICKSTRKELDLIQNRLSKEIRLSEQAIQEGGEGDDRKK